jgi:hypothetical protein
VSTLKKSKNLQNDDDDGGGNYDDDDADPGEL